jgi:hypothetical protein
VLGLRLAMLLVIVFIGTIFVFRCFLFNSLLIRVITLVIRCFLFTSLFIKIIRDCYFETIIIMNLRFCHSGLVSDEVY